MDAAERRFLTALASLSTSAEAKAFLADMLTPVEYRDVVKRWRVMEMLAAGRSQREIAAALSLSLCKITRGSRILKSPRAAVAKFLKGKA